MSESTVTGRSNSELEQANSHSIENRIFLQDFQWGGIIRVNHKVWGQRGRQVCFYDFLETIFLKLTEFIMGWFRKMGEDSFQFDTIRGFDCPKQFWWLFPPNPHPAHAGIHFKVNLYFPFLSLAQVLESPHFIQAGKGGNNIQFNQGFVLLF